MLLSSGHIGIVHRFAEQVEGPAHELLTYPVRQCVYEWEN